MTVFVTLLVCPIDWRNQPALDVSEPFLALEWPLPDNRIGRNSAAFDLDEQPVIYRCHESDGALRAEGQATLGQLLEGLGLRDAMAARLGLAGSYVPLFLHARFADSEATYSCVILHWDRLLFLNTGARPLDPQAPPDAGAQSATAIRNQALLGHAEWRLFLNNHNNFSSYKKDRPDDEMEYKYNLDGGVDTWRLATQLYRSAARDILPGFTLHVAHPITHWDYDNYLFEISAPLEEKGYISFIPTPQGMYIIKRKVYPEDTLIRKEYRQREVTIDGSFEDHLREHFPGLVHRRLPHFKRVRYDVDFELLATGNIYVVMFDRSTVTELDCPPLVQCEVEYLHTRSCYQPRAVLDELAVVKEAVHAFLVEQGAQPVSTYYSKLTYLKDCVARLRGDDGTAPAV